MRYLIAFFLVILSTSAWSARYIQLEVTDEDYRHLPVMDSLTGSEYLLSAIGDEGALKVQRVRFGSGGWRALPAITTDLVVEAGWRVIDMVALQPGAGAFVLLEKNVCDDDNCEVTSRRLGKLNASLSAFEEWAAPPVCDGEAVLTTNLIWPIVADGCGNITVYDAPGEIRLDTVAPSPQQGVRYPIIAENALAETRLGLLNNGVLSILTLTQNEEDFSFSWAREDIDFSSVLSDAGCQLTALPSSPLMCFDDNGDVRVYDRNAIAQTLTALVEDPARSMTPLFLDSDRVFFLERASAIEGEGEDAIEAVSMLLHNTSIGADDILNTHDTGYEALDDVFSHMSGDGNHGMLAFLSPEEALILGLYTQLNVNHPPIFKGLTGVGMATETVEEQSFTLVDEESPSETLTVSNSEPLPGFALLNQAERVITYSPQHVDAGQYLVNLVATDPQDNEMPVQFPVNVVLTPYQWQVFESTLFAQIEEDSPLPVGPLFSAITRWPLQEDVEVTLRFTWLNRDDSDVTVVFDQMPDFMRYDDDADTLTISPQQKDVGRYVLQATLSDMFSEIDVEPETVRLAFEVFEVDEPLTITSDGNATIDVNEPYTYTLAVEDEETSVEQMRVELIEVPDFLTFDRDNLTLSGTPTQEDTGPNEVQLVISDMGGHRVLHKFTVRVISTQNDVEKNGGSVTLLSFLLLTFWTLSRRRLSA